MGAVGTRLFHSVNLNKGLREMNDQRDRFMNEQSSVLLTRKKNIRKGMMVVR